MKYSSAGIIFAQLLRSSSYEHLPKSKSKIIKTGDFFFKYRDKAFPIIIVLLFLLVKPPITYNGDAKIVEIKDVIAWAISLTGLLLRALVIGFAYIKRGGKNKQVYADNLVVEGMYKICRNTLYVGNMLIYFGVFLLHGAPFVIIVGTLLFYFIYICIIATEENFLRNKFGAEYDAYANTASRWLINFSKFRVATADMHFNFMKVIIKDYPTIFTTLFILIIIQQYKYYPIEGWTPVLITLAFLCVIMTLVIRFLKKSKIITYE